jgi:hypothetical protein
VQDEVEAFAEIEARKGCHEPVFILVIDLVREKVVRAGALKEGGIIGDHVATGQVVQCF